jgi:hypothetical protein
VKLSLDVEPQALGVVLEVADREVLADLQSKSPPRCEITRPPLLALF